MKIFICSVCGDLVMPGTETKATKGRHRRPMKMHRVCYEQMRSSLKDPVHLAMSAYYRETNAACVKCGSTQDVEADHKVSRQDGGTNDVSNYQPLCKSCNSAKGG